MPKILAIDPGPEQSAFVLWDGSRVIHKDILPNDMLIGFLWEFAHEGECDILAIEMIACFGMAVGRETFETCVWIGRFMQMWLEGSDRQESSILRIPRGDIKMHLCRSMRAKDANVRQALIDRFGAPGTKKAPGALYGVTSHCWAALALAVCAFDRLKVEEAAA